MGTIEITAAINELNELEALIAEAKEQAESIKDALKAEMTSRAVSELEAGQFIIRWTNVVSNRFDSASFKKSLPEVYKAYMKQSSSRRFSVSKL